MSSNPYASDMRDNGMVERAIAIIENGEVDVATGLGTFTADERDTILRALEVSLHHSALVKSVIALLATLKDWERHPPSVVAWRTEVHQAMREVRNAMPDGYDLEAPPATVGEYLDSLGGDA